MNSEFWSAIGSIATAVTAVITLAAVMVALRAAKYTSQQATLLKVQIDAHQASKLVEVHSRFQSEVRAIQRTFPPNVNDPAWTPNEAEMRSITMYWYLVFDEWLTCTQMGSDLAPLWSKHYAEGVKSALRLPAFKARIEEIFRGDSSFFGYGQDFKKEIESLCFTGTGKPLKP
jgi:hypothetical protein